MKTICLVGNPNVGKTTLFNLLAQQHAQVINASGTTIRAREAIVNAPDGTLWKIVDMPGIYSKHAQKGEEKSAWEVIEKYRQDPDVIFVQVINAGQWRHSLAVTLDLQQQGVNPILLFNTKHGDAEPGQDFYHQVESEFATVVLWGDIEARGFGDYFWQHISESTPRPLPQRDRMDDGEKFALIEKLFADTAVAHKDSGRLALLLDRVFLHSVFGIITFLAIMWVLFETTFVLGAIPMDWIDLGISSLQTTLRQIVGTGFWSRLLVDGLLTGVGGTLVFLPNIVTLFFLLSLLQQSGYLARTSYLFDVFFKKLGISGKASVHLLMGFGCNVPSVMATRSLESRKEKIIVAMMTLFMSCSARLPVYALLISAFIPLPFQGIVLFCIYASGIGIGLVTGRMIHTQYRGRQKTRLLEVMPRLMLPSPVKALRFAGYRGKVFLLRIGKFIVPASVVLWLIFSFPAAAVEDVGIEASYGAQLAQTVQPVFAPLGFDWRITAGILSGLSAKEVMVATFAGLYTSGGDGAELSTALQNSESFTLATALALLVFTLLYTPCIPALGAVRAEIGTKWMLFAAVYPTVIAWIMALAVYRIALLF